MHIFLFCSKVKRCQLLHIAVNKAFRSSLHFFRTGKKNEPKTGAIFSFSPVFTNFGYGQRPENQWHVCLLACVALLPTHVRRHVAIYLRGDIPVVNLLPAPWNTYKVGNAINSGRNLSHWQAARDSRALIAFGQPQHKNYSH